jgi:hypothetical protein
MNLENKRILKDRIGEENINTQGLKMWIKEYRKAIDIDVEFEDGFISYNKEYKTFKNGKIENKNYLKEKRIGEEKINNRGNKMTIIDYEGSGNVTIKFDNGHIMKCTYGDFVRGKPRSPYDKDIDWENYIGEVSYNNVGEKMVIIDFRIKCDMTVRFEDGYEIKTTYQKFKSGKIKNPYSKRVYRCWKL